MAKTKELDTNKLLEIYNQGRSVEFVAARLNVSPYQVRKYLIATGNLRKDGQKGTKNRKPVQSKTTGEIYKSLSEAARKNNVSLTALSQAVALKQQCAKQYWRYL